MVVLAYNEVTAIDVEGEPTLKLINDRNLSMQACRKLREPLRALILFLAFEQDLRQTHCNDDVPLMFKYRVVIATAKIHAYRLGNNENAS